MRISKSSWHYRFLAWLGNEPATSLCRYFWQVAFAVSLPGILLMIVGGLILFVLGTLSEGLSYVLRIALITAAWMLIVWVARKVFGGVKALLRMRRREEPSLIVQYVKAKKAAHLPGH